MDALPPNSVQLSPTDEENGVVDVNLDAGALFVLKSRGSWWHCGYHLTTAIVSPALLTLPFTLSLLGWFAGLFWLIFACFLTFYSYNLLSVVLEHHAKHGQRQLRFRDMAKDILGPRWGKYYVGPLQVALCYGGVVAYTLLGGQILHLVYLLFNPSGAMKLFNFFIMFGVVVLVLGQIPSFHSLRHINLVSLVLCLAYSVCVTIGSIYIGNSHKSSSKHYSINGAEQNRIFNALYSISIIASSYACGVLPEIQATLAPPVQGKMLKGLCMCYSVVVFTFFSVAISGYWAFGNQAKGTLLSNFIDNQKKPILPTWFLFITYFFTMLQVTAVTVVYLQPSNEILENKFANPNMGEYSFRNMLPRLITRSISVVIATVLAAMLPFFGDIMALFGAFACIPLNFILPMVFYNVTFKPSKNSVAFWGNTIIAVVSTILAVVGAIAAVRQMFLHAKEYHLFPNV
ncbi:GABA transporter 1-like [Quillaja saponaria]|uniref:GABA transporter 1-like n=1 Tax=Quillaja saponaria TaxID=32244 RepID=A0AAD7M804_QUISA|nr:GABA transporter 1-like [Quillaja saponaria]